MSALAGARLLLLPRYPAAGASSRLRMLQFVPALESAGAEVTVSPFFDDPYLRTYYASGAKPLGAAARGYWRRSRALATARADLIWIEKELFPFLPGLAERAVGLRAIPYVVDYDDAIFHHYDLSSRRMVRTLLGRKLDPLLSAAAAATVGNTYLGDYARVHGARRVVEVPTVVDPCRYPVQPPPRPGGPLRIGWIGTPANARYLDVVIEALRRVQASTPVVLVTIGAPGLLDLPVPQERHEWREADEAALLATIDIGVMPLPDDPFERGKCGYKLIQYMAAGRPVIASPVGVNRSIVTPDVGFLAADVAGWTNALTALASDPVQRRRMGQAGRALVERSYSVAGASSRLIALFADILA